MSSSVFYKNPIMVAAGKLAWQTRLANQAARQAAEDATKRERAQKRLTTRGTTTTTTAGLSSLPAARKAISAALQSKADELNGRVGELMAELRTFNTAITSLSN